MLKTQEKIMERINSSSYGSFTTSDFADIANYKSVSKSLELLEDKQILKKAKRGVYYKPIFNNAIKMECAPNLDDVANAIARQYNWNIVPSGNYALNLIGISTQVPSKIVYCSSGPYREYEVGANKLIFKHTTTKEITDLRLNNLIAIQALKELGKDNISIDDMKLIDNFLSIEDKQEITQGIRITSWIYDTLRRAICITSQN